MGEPESEIRLQTSQLLSQGSELLSRVATFLPKLREANDNLEDVTTKEKIDCDLEKHDESDGNSESPDDNDSTLDERETSTGQVIEMNIAVGDVSENPVFRMLGDDTKDSNDSDSDSESSEQSTHSSELAVQNLLTRKRTSSQDIPEQNKKSSKSSPLIKVIHESK